MAAFFRQGAFNGVQVAHFGANLAHKRKNYELNQYRRGLALGLISRLLEKSWTHPIDFCDIIVKSKSTHRGFYLAPSQKIFLRRWQKRLQTYENFAFPGFIYMFFLIIHRGAQKELQHAQLGSNLLFCRLINLGIIMNR